ncbi:MAG: ABC transporter permease, partial [Acidobacteriaceae bacterium]|nr:ABC transporter permease [Acidobacteriaceae bacterium]
GNYFDVLGLRPALGRLIEPADVRAGAPVAVVSWAYWKNELHGDRNVIGERIRLQKELFTVIGVVSHAYVGPFPQVPTDVWFPRKPSAEGGLGLIARLKPGITIDQARAQMSVLYQFTIRERAARSSDPLVWKLRVEVAPARNGINFGRDRIGAPVVILMCIVGLLLLIMCTNVAGLLLARGAAREREFAVRVGLGASRGRLIRQVLTESLLLSISGALVGVLFAYWGTSALETVLAHGRITEQMFLHLRPDWHVLQFAIATAFVAGLLFGIAPAWNAVRHRPAAALRAAGGSATRSNRVFGKVLVTAQVALSMLLLSTGVLFVANLWNLQHQYLGFQRDHVLVVTLDQSDSGFTGPQVYHAYGEVLTRVSAMPGVQSASLCAPSPLSGAGASGFANVEGYQERPSDKRWIKISYAAPNYFETMGIPFLHGSTFPSQDQTHPRMLIVNETFAHRYFAGRDPVGKRVTLYHVTLDPEPKTYEVIGVVADAHYSEIREQASSGVYLPAFHDGFMSANNLVIRTHGDPEALVPDVRVLLAQAMGGRVPVMRATTLAAQIDASILPERLIAMLSAFFAAVGALIIGIGIYGLLAYSVARRTREIAIRVALGASVAQVKRMVLGDTFSVVLAGLLVGIPLSVAGRRLALRLMQDLAVSTAAPVVAGSLGLILIALI